MSDINWDNVNIGIEKFTLKNYTTICKCVKVYDGDTIHVVFQFNNKLCRWVCRIEGVDTPELRSNNEKEKEYAYVVKEKLQEKILDKVLKIVCGDFDKYGRLLITIYEKSDENDKSINDWLIENNYAYKYDGGTKTTWNLI
jgi:endonuclease YncB( thermonuclease family)